MKKKSLLTLFIQILLIVLIVSCKSAPPPAPTEVPKQEESSQPSGPSQASIDALNRAKVSADEARKRAIDFESPDYFPSDWEDAESKLASAGKMPISTEEQVRQVTVSYNACTDTYNALFKKTIPLYAQAREDEIISARDELIATGLTGTFPEYLQEADDLALLALSQYEAEDYYFARDNAFKALYKYEAFTFAAGVYLVRQEIIDRDFIIYDQDNFYKAEDVALLTLDEFEAENYEDAEDYALEAQLRYNLALKNGWIGYATSRRVSATNEREQALFLKANIAVRDLYREADGFYSQAETAMKAEQYENAAIRYIESEARFIVAIKEAEEKRQLAEYAIRNAEDKIEESDDTARQADTIIEGGSR